jgi:putative ABC transport system ATP-binding protein
MAGLLLQLRDVGVSFNSTSLFSGISFSVDAGQSVAIVGPSGSGKSTLLACIAGFVQPSDGSIVLAGTNVTSATEGELARIRRELIGNAFQDPHLLEELTVRENVELPARFRVSRGEARRRAEQALADVETLHLADRWTHELSGGEAQRVALARALATGSQLVLADEPTASLDRSTASRVADVMIESTSRANLALVVATHDPLVAERCDQIVDLSAMRAV